MCIKYMAKRYQIFRRGRRALESGVNQWLIRSRSLFGPKGRNVVLDKKFGSPVITNDGVTIAKEIELEDKFENMGVSS